MDLIYAFVLDFFDLLSFVRFDPVQKHLYPLLVSFSSIGSEVLLLLPHDDMNNTQIIFGYNILLYNLDHINSATFMGISSICVE